MVQAPVTIPVQLSILSFDFHHKDLNIIRLFKLWIKHFKTFKVPIPLIQCYAPQKLNLDLIFSNLPALCSSPSLPNYFWSISELFAQFFAKSAHPCNIPFYFFSLKTCAHEKGIFFFIFISTPEGHERGTFWRVIISFQSGTENID